MDGTLLTAVRLLYCLLAWLLPSLILGGVETHILLLAGTQILSLLAAGTQQQYICLYSFFTRRSHPAIFLRTPSCRSPLYRKRATTCLPLSKRATRGRLKSSTRLTLDAHETGRARSRPRHSFWGEPPEAGSGDKTGDGGPYHHPDPPTKRVDPPVQAEKKTDQPPPDSGASRRQLSPALGERHQLPPPRCTGHHRHHLDPPLSTERQPQLSRDWSAHDGGMHLAYAAAWAQRALDDANQTILQREAHRRRFHEDIERAKTAAREASMVVKRRLEASCVVCGGIYCGPLAFDAPAGCQIPVATTRGQHLFEGQRRVHDFCTEGRVLPSVGDRVGRNGLRPPPVRPGPRRGKRTPFHWKRPRLACIVRSTPDRRETPRPLPSSRPC